MRFPFVFVLSPIFVWAAAWAPGGWSGRTVLGFLLVHLALYPGANAYNSAFDRDEGPIGGLARPPAVPRGLEAASAALQAVGAALAPLVGWSFAAAYLALWAIFTAYSHPRTRWKRSPVASTAAIVAGQGGLGFWLGWSAAGGGWPPGGVGAWALLTAVGAVAAGYPWTQAYQIEEDRGRADRTVAAAIGPRGTLVWAAAGTALVAVSTWALGRDVLAVGFGLVAAAAVVAAAALPGGWTPSHRLVMTTMYAQSAIVLAYVIAFLA
ncbi:MAG TPA: UbiA family prenyltransferase [Gemmatimonadota bacterium]|nr:UbiA family prenyltransferase [Gemmatimonadota bacterium]